MFKYIPTSVILAFSLCGVSSAQNVAPQKELTLEQCIDIALKNNFGVKAAKNEVETAKALQGTAWDLEKTSLSLGQDPTSGGSPDNALKLSQTFEFPTVYAARRNTLKAETAMAQNRSDISRKQLGRDVAETYTEIVYCLAKLNILISRDSILGKYLHIANTRYKAGEARQLEKLAANRMKRENDMDIDMANAEYRSQLNRIKRLMNTETEFVPADRQLVPIKCEKAADFDYSRSAEGMLGANTVERAERAVKEAKSAYLPNFSVGLSTQMVIKSWNPYGVDRSRFSKGNFMGFEVGVGLPLFFGSTRAKVKAANLQRETAELYKREEMQRRQSEYDTQRNKLDAARRQMDYYFADGLNEAAETERIAQVSYENGDIGYIEYIQGLLEAMNTRLKYIGAVKEYNIALINLRAIAQ